MDKQPFDIDIAIERLREAVQPFPQAGLFVLQAEGYGTPFEILVACILSIRTLDEVMIPLARRLFQRARTPAEMIRLSPEELDREIQTCTFHEAKARQIHALSQRLVEEYEGVLPCEESVVLSFAGVGPKCAGLTLGIACGQPFIGVDIHVHRVTNRWGYVQSSEPEKTLEALKERLPRGYWVEINRLLVPFGKHICTGNRPRCSTCPLRDMCQQVGVMDPR
ncbi:MAG TPA: endonuclease III [Chthonomonadaceae bacterium]|nr:endonuclease III [Chthonomonadaceae bacterium]